MVAPWNNPEFIWQLDDRCPPGLPTVVVATSTTWTNHGPNWTQIRADAAEERKRFTDKLTPVSLECLGCSAPLPPGEWADLGYITTCEYCGRWHTLSQEIGR